MKKNIIFNGVEYAIIDTMEHITIADCFSKNKTGSGHGESKLYVGSESKRNEDFYDDIDNLDCFFSKRNFVNYLEKIHQEFSHPSQNYSTKDKMPALHDAYVKEVEGYKDDVLHFEMRRVEVTHPGIYLNSKSEYYKLIRKIGVPQLSYLSAMRLKDTKGDVHLYFTINTDLDYNPLIYQATSEEQGIIDSITNNKKIKETERIQLIKARIGQGKFREGLLREYSFCPITGVDDRGLLVASHIKPWSKSNNKERLNPKNGILLTPTYDKLFDKGLISFGLEHEKAHVLVSPWLSEYNQRKLKLDPSMEIRELRIDEERESFLKFHRNNIYKQI